MVAGPLPLQQIYCCIFPSTIIAICLLMCGGASTHRNRNFFFNLDCKIWCEGFACKNNGSGESLPRPHLFPNQNLNHVSLPLVILLLLGPAGRRFETSPPLFGCLNRALLSQHLLAARGFVVQRFDCSTCHKCLTKSNRPQSGEYMPTVHFSYLTDWNMWHRTLLIALHVCTEHLMRLVWGDIVPLQTLKAECSWVWRLGSCSNDQDVAHWEWDQTDLPQC